MTINIVPNPLTTEPQSIGKLAAPWTSVHSEQAHLSYLRLHAFTEDISGHSQQVQDLQALYSSQLDDNSMSVFSSILHMRLDGLYIGNARVVLNSEIDTVNSKLLAFFGDISSQHLGIKSHYDYLEDGWDSLVQIVARIKGLVSLSTDIADLDARVTELETNGTPSTGGGATVLADLTDVTISTTNLSTHLFLKHNTTTGAWENAQIEYADITGTPSLTSYLTQDDTDALYPAINTYNALNATVVSNTSRIAALEGVSTPTPLTTSGSAGSINVADGSGGLQSTDWVITASTVSGVAEPMTMAGHILPNENAVHDIGSAEYKIRHLYLSDNSITMAPQSEFTSTSSWSATHVSFDAEAGGLVSSTERPYLMSELDAEFGAGATLVLEALINDQEYVSTDPKTGKTIRITGDSSYWSTATGNTVAAHDGQTLTYTTRYTLNRDNIVIGQGSGISVGYSDGQYTISADETLATKTYVDTAVDGLATETYVDTAIAGINDADTTYTAAAPLSIDGNNQITIDSSVYTYTSGEGITISPEKQISLNTSNFVTQNTLAGYQQTLSTSDSSEISISSNTLSLRALDPYRPGFYGNVPADGADIIVSQQRGSASAARDGALLPRYNVLEHVVQSDIGEYSYTGSTVVANQGNDQLNSAANNLHKVVSTPNTSMYFVSVLGNELLEASKTDTYWEENVFGRFHDKMLEAGWVAPSAQELYDYSPGKISLGGNLYVGGDRVNHPALHVVDSNPGAVAPTIHVSADGIINEPLIVRAYSGQVSNIAGPLGNVFLYKLDQQKVGLDKTQTRSVLAIGPVMRHQDKTSSSIKTTITPMYGITEALSPEEYTANPNTTAFFNSVTNPLQIKVADSGLTSTDILEVGYYIVWDSSVMDPDSGGVPHGANLRFFRDATVFIENEGYLSHVSYQNAWLPVVVSHEDVRLPGELTLDSLYVHHLEVTSNNSALFTNGMQILNTDVCNLLGGAQDLYDHDTMDSGLLVVTSGELVTVTNQSNLNEQVKKIDTFASLYYDSSSDEWRMTKGTNGKASVSGSVGTYVDTSGNLTALNATNGRPTSGLRGTRVDASAQNSERILTESDITDFVTASTLNNYASASSVTSLTDTVNSLSLTTTLEDLTDVNIVAASLTEGQYLKWDNTQDKWVAGDTSDLTTGVTSVNGSSGVVTLGSDNIAEGSTNLYYTDTRVGAYLTANSYATEGYVDTAVDGLASTTYVDNAITTLIDGSPDLLNTLDELAAALGDDENFATTVTNSIATKADKSQTITASTGIVTAGSLGAGVTVSLATITGFSGGTFGSATKVPSLTVDTYGRVTAATLVDVHNFSGDYEDLTSKPTLFDGAYSSLTGAPTLSTVATTGAYADLTGLPSLFSGDYDDLTSKPTLFDGAYSSLTGAPALSTVATTGSYNDLTGKPDLFDGAYSSLTGAPTLFDGAYASLTGTPTLSAVATSGAYEDLTGTPDLTDHATQTYVTNAVANFITASSVSDNYALQSTLDNTKIIDLADVNVTAGSLTSGQYLKWDGSDWVLGSASDFTTGVTSVSGESGITVSGTGAVTVTADTNVLATVESLTALSNTVSGKQDSFTVGTGLTLSGGTLSSTVSLTGYATENYVDTAVSNLVGSAPQALDTLQELATALGQDANFATTVTNSIAAKQDQLTQGSNVTITGSTISVDLSAYATASTLNNYVLTSTADSTYADATATANSLNALNTRVGSVEAYTITLADNEISINGGVIAAATLTTSLSSSMSTALGIDSLATADSLNALKTVVDGRVSISAVGDGLALSGAGTLSATVDLSGYSTSTEIANTYVTQADADATYASATTTASSITALSSRLDDIEDDYLTSTSTLAGANVSGNISGQAGSVASLSGHTISLAGNVISLSGGSITAASLSESLKTEMSTDLGISSLAANSDLTAVSGRVAAIENDYLTSSSTLSSANLNNKSVTVAGLSVDLGGSITANSLSTALSLSSYAPASTLSNYTTTTDFDALETTVNARQNITAIGDGLSLSNGTLSTSFSIGDYVTATTLGTQLNTKQDTLTAGSNISITGSTIAVASALSSAVAANTAKTGITAEQATAITTNTAKVGYTDALARGAISPAGDVSYNSSTGVISYTSQWTADSGKITTENVVLVPGHLIEVFDMGTITSSADYSMDAGSLSGSVDRVVECGILDQERLF